MYDSAYVGWTDPYDIVSHQADWIHRKNLIGSTGSTNESGNKIFATDAERRRARAIANGGSSGRGSQILRSGKQSIGSGKQSAGGLGMSNKYLSLLEQYANLINRR